MRSSLICNDFGHEKSWRHLLAGPLFAVHHKHSRILDSHTIKFEVEVASALAFDLLDLGSNSLILQMITDIESNIHAFDPRLRDSYRVADYNAMPARQIVDGEHSAVSVRVRNAAGEAEAEEESCLLATVTVYL